MKCLQYRFPVSLSQWVSMCYTGFIGLRNYINWRQNTPGMQRHGRQWYGNCCQRFSKGHSAVGFVTIAEVTCYQKMYILHSITCRFSHSTGTEPGSSHETPPIDGECSEAKMHMLLG